MKNKLTNKGYTEFWSDNLQKIETAHKNLENSINELEKKYSDFEPDYNNIKELVELLLSIYKDLQFLPGYEEIKELKELLSYYNKKFSKKALDFEYINKLVMEIGEKLNKNFSDFPIVNHLRNYQNKYSVYRKINYDIYKYKWVTFKRNNSWFILPFNKIKIIHANEFELEYYENSDTVDVKYNDKIITAVDIFSKSTADIKEPTYCVVTDNDNHKYLADQVGRTFCSKNNIIKPLLKKFEKIKTSRISSGRVRIFGINHILLN